MHDLQSIWVYLSTSPLLHLTMTLVAFQIGMAFYRRFNLNPLFNPVLVAVAIVVTLLSLTRTDYATYFAGAQFVHFLLGPATVALAIPLYRQFSRVRNSAKAIVVSIVSGSLIAAISAVVVGRLLGASHEALLSLAPKSVTAPVAMGVAERIGGLPSLTAVLVIATGILGAMIGPPLFHLIGIQSWQARGIAIGTASHGIGTARALQVNETAGAFAGLAMGLNALATSMLLPAIIRLLL